MAAAGNSNTITRRYLDSLLIETRYTGSTNPDTAFTLYGRSFATPIMTAALSHLKGNAPLALAEGARDAGAVLWYGMAEEAEIEALAGTGADLIEIIKPYRDRSLIYQKIRHAEKTGLLAVGIDIDHPFGADGSPDVVDGFEMKALSAGELEEICKASSLPVICKGVLSVWDAENAVKAGAGGIVLSHHNNRIAWAVPPLLVLPEILKVAGGRMPVFVDGEIAGGMDAFKALALGAAAVSIGRPLMKAAMEEGAEGVAKYLRTATAELAKAMAYTGCTDLSRMDATVIHQLPFGAQ